MRRNMRTRRGAAADFLLSTLRRETARCCGAIGTAMPRFRACSTTMPFLRRRCSIFMKRPSNSGICDDAIAITEKQRELFEDEAGGFFASAHEDTSRLMRIKDDYDGAEPSGNSVALMNLLRLHRNHRPRRIRNVGAQADRRVPARLAGGSVRHAADARRRANSISRRRARSWLRAIVGHG